MLRGVFLLLISAISFSVSAQIGGNSVFDFVNLPASGRVTGAGGAHFVRDNDPTLGFHNPSLLNKDMHHRISASTVSFVPGLNHGNFSYTRHYPGIATFQGAIQYVSYGEMTRTDFTAAPMGTFNAGEMAFQVGGAYQMDRYSYGANFKFLYGKIDNASSLGLAFDLAASYSDSSGSFTASILLKNIGVQLTSYVPGERAPLPFEIQIGVSKRFKHLPFRIGLILHNLNRYNVRYDDPNAQEETTLFGDTTANDSKRAAEVFDNLARHVIINGEFYFGKFMSLNFAYNHMRRQELAVDTKKGLTGFSFGVNLYIKQFTFSVARARYHIARASTQFTVQVNMSAFKKKKTREAQPLPIDPVPPANDSSQ